MLFSLPGILFSLLPKVYLVPTHPSHLHPNILLWLPFQKASQDQAPLCCHTSRRCTLTSLCGIPMGPWARNGVGDALAPCCTPGPHRASGVVCAVECGLGNRKEEKRAGGGPQEAAFVRGVNRSGAWSAGSCGGTGGGNCTDTDEEPKLMGRGGGKESRLRPVVCQ